MSTPIEEIRAKIEAKLANARATANERVAALGFTFEFPIFKRPGTNNNVTPQMRRQSQLAPFNRRGIASNIRGFSGLSGQGTIMKNIRTRADQMPMLKKMRGRRQRPMGSQLHPGIVDTAKSAVERAKGAFPVSSRLSVEM